MTESQRAITTSPESEAWIARAQHSGLAALKMNHQRTRRLPRTCHQPTLNMALPPDHLSGGSPLVIDGSEEFY